jgi:glutamine synthetase
MTTQQGDPSSGDETIADYAGRLREHGARTLSGVICDSSGVLRAKTVPATRIETFAVAGMGASLTWPVFAVDNGVAMTDQIGVVGDLRLTADLTTAVVLDEGFGWAAADVRDQRGERSPFCWRDVPRRQTDRLADLGISALVGNEMEFGLIAPDGRPVGAEDGWPCYGVGVYSELSGFAADLCERLDAVGIPVEQIHAEYGTGQFEVSLPPRAPITAADNVVLARTVIGRTARTHGLRVSFSPAPFAGDSGNGAHVHVSFSRQRQPLLSGGTEQAGLTADGAHAIAGIAEHLPASIAVLAGTPVSAARLQPGHWSGSFSCWGVENREAALRLLQANNGNPRGANIEIKCVDAGANPYLALGLILGMAAEGIENRTHLLDEVSVNPLDLTEEAAAAAGVVPLPVDPESRNQLFEKSSVVQRILGDPMHAAVLAVRRYEATLFEGQDPHALTRFSWSG